MDPDQLAHWKAADALFDRWLDVPPPDRDAWLEAQQPAHPVHRRLLQLIGAHQRPCGAMEPARGNLAGRRLGGWTLESELGRGGMAVVYRAWRDQGMARQQAAVKILTVGALGATGHERFGREAGILARLNHPNVTALLDSGVAGDGTRWLAMPLVDGERIDAWCEAQLLQTRAIVRLYVQVCDAVAYAHRNLVIHRDLKPSNVLVDRDGHVRLLDFGIGQFVDARGEQTHTLWRALTPGYAAPEQLRGDPPTTAVDIYGLGALLHRLLTGHTPQGSEHGTRPSLLVQDAGNPSHRHCIPLKSDLDRVLLKALAEEPEQRYVSADALADDLRRWLDGHPVQAQNPRFGYRLRKYVSRNKAGVGAAALLAICLAGGVAATLWQAGEARREAHNARTQAQRAVLVRDFLAHVFNATEPASGGVPSALELLDEGARRARADILHTDPLAAADILMLTGGARRALDALGPARDDLALAAEILSVQAADAHAERANIQTGLGHILRETGDPEAAVLHARQAVELGARSLEEHGDPVPLLDAKTGLGKSLYELDRTASRAEFDAVLEALPEYGLLDTRVHLEALVGLSEWSFHDDIREHALHAEEVIRVSRLVHGPGSGRYVYALADSTIVFQAAGDDQRARQVAFEAVELAERIYEFPHSTKALAYCAAGGYFYYSGRGAQSLPYYALADRIYAQIPNNQYQIQSCIRMSGEAHLGAGNLEAAIERLELAWGIGEQLDFVRSLQASHICGLLASAWLRMEAVERAERTLARCAATAGRSLLQSQAQAELHLARGEGGEAMRLALETLQRHPLMEGALERNRMRPWMLSWLAAHEAGDMAVQAALVSGLGGLADTPLLADCMATPTRNSCLAIP